MQNVISFRRGTPLYRALNAVLPSWRLPGPFERLEWDLSSIDRAMQELGFDPVTDRVQSGGLEAWAAESPTKASLVIGFALWLAERGDEDLADHAARIVCNLGWDGPPEIRPLAWAQWSRVLMSGRLDRKYHAHALEGLCRIRSTAWGKDQERHIALANAMLGEYWALGYSGKPDLEAADEYLDEAAEAGFTAPLVKVALLLEEQAMGGQEPDRDKLLSAFLLHETALYHGHPNDDGTCKAAMARMVLGGHIPERTAEDGWEKYTLAAARGNADAIKALTEAGRPVPPLKKAA